MYHKAEDNPCYACGERQFGCHSGCSKYKEYRKMLDEEKKAETEGRLRDYPNVKRKIKKWRIWK